MEISPNFESFLFKTDRALRNAGLNPTIRETVSVARALYLSPNPESEHERLVQIALQDGGFAYVEMGSHSGRTSILEYVKSHQKILAIKRLRKIASCDLRAAKNAVEDHRVLAAAF